jgi:hypothetical protein
MTLSKEANDKKAIGKESAIRIEVILIDKQASKEEKELPLKNCFLKSITPTYFSTQQDNAEGRSA